MASNIVLRVTKNNINYDLPVDVDTPIRLDSSVLENNAIGEVFAAGSQTFTIPGTSKVNTFFEHAYDLGIDSVPGMYFSLPCTVLVDSDVVLEGKLTLNNIITDDYGYVSYEVEVYDSVVDFKQLLSDKLIKDANFSDLDHLLTSASIVDSWTGSLLAGNVFYPLVDYGSDETTSYPSIPSIQVSGVGYSGSIDCEGTPMRSQQFLPAVKVNKLLDVITSQVGFSVTSSFLNTDDFNKVYLLPKAKEGLGINSDIEQDSMFASGSVTTQILFVPQQSGPGSDTLALDLDQEVSDPGNNYNPVTSRYTIPRDGNYSYQVTVRCRIVPGYDDLPVIGLRLLGEDIYGSIDIVSPTQQYTIDPSKGIITIDITLKASSYFEKGLQIWPQINLVTKGPSTGDFTVVIYNDLSLFRVLDAPQNYEGGLVEIGKQFDPDTKSVDILNGILQQFNLVVVPEPTQDRVLRIEPFDDWLKSGRLIDWTDRYDTAKRIQITHTVKDQPREILFENAQDADRISKLTQESLPNFQYGSKRVLSVSDVSQGKREIGKVLAPITLASIIQSGSTTIGGEPDLALSDSEFVFPHLYKYNNSRRESFKFKPRIGYKVDNLQPIGAYNNSIYLGTPEHHIPVTEYSTLSNVNEIPVTKNVSKDLHFNNTYPSYGPASLQLTSGSNNFVNYWETYIESLYWEGSKKVVADIFFEPYEYRDIRLNDKVMIKNQYYRINKISGFNISEPAVAQVELIKLYPEYFQAPIAGVPITPTPTPAPTPPACTEYYIYNNSKNTGVTFSHTKCGGTGELIPVSPLSVKVVCSVTGTLTYVSGTTNYTISDNGECTSVTPTPTPTPTATSIVPTPTPTPTPTATGIVPTPTPTPTATPVFVTPTPTPTSAPAVQYGITSGQASSNDACFGLAFTPVYFASSVGTQGGPENGNFAYTDPGLTTPLNGGNQWYGIDYLGGDGAPERSFTIGTNGLLNNRTDC